MADQSEIYLSLEKLTETWGCTNAWGISRVIAEWLRYAGYRKDGKATQLALDICIVKPTRRGYAWHRGILARYFPGYAHVRPDADYLSAIRIATRLARINHMWERNNEFPTNQMAMAWQEAIGEAIDMGVDWRRVTAHLCYQKASFVIIDEKWELEFIMRKRNNSAA